MQIVVWKKTLEPRWNSVKAFGKVCGYPHIPYYVLEWTINTATRKDGICSLFMEISLNLYKHFLLNSMTSKWWTFRDKLVDIFRDTLLIIALCDYESIVSKTLEVDSLI